MSNFVRTKNKTNDNCLKSNVCTEIVAHSLCIGCGLCAGICPKGRLEMRFNERGEYNPVELKDSVPCPEKCSLCYQVCPVHGDTKNETDIGRELYSDVDGMRYRSETGYYLSSYLGYSNVADHRKNGTSGGMATWTLETLLKSGQVDAVVAVGHSGPPNLFEFRICKTATKIRQCSRSAYSPVETSRVIRYILEHDGQYAIIGLPCVCKAIRLAQDKLPTLKNRIKFVLGLVCGHQTSKFFAEYLCAAGGKDPHALREVTFRVKTEHTTTAARTFTQFQSGEGDESEAGSTGSGRFSFIRGSGCFQVEGCFYCDDVFAECADLVFMDAWLFPYETIPEGNSIMLFRNPELLAWFDCPETVSRLDVRSVIKSQSPRLSRKRRGNATVIKSVVRLSNPKVPIRLRSLHNTTLSPFASLKYRARYSNAIDSAKQWQLCDKNIIEFDKAMIPGLRKYAFYSKMAKLLLPVRIWDLIRRWRCSSYK